LRLVHMYRCIRDSRQKHGLKQKVLRLYPEDRCVVTHCQKHGLKQKVLRPHPPGSLNLCRPSETWPQTEGIATLLTHSTSPSSSVRNMASNRRYCDDRGLFHPLPASGQKHGLKQKVLRPPIS